MEICAGENVKVLVDEKVGKVFISAPEVNKTRIKQGAFILSGPHVELVAGTKMVVKSIHPDKVVLEVDVSEEQLRILTLEKKVETLEKIAGLLIKDRKK
jgi:hypothetical protein